MDDALKLIPKVSSFANQIIRAYTDLGKRDLKAFQERYLCQQTIGATQMADSFWVLFHSGKHNASKIIARHLLERVYSARVAFQSPEDAVDLIVYELTEKIRRMKQFHESIPALELSPEVQRAIHVYEEDVQSFRKLLQREPTKLDFFARAERANLSWSYRSMYWDFSRFVHASFEEPRSISTESPDLTAVMLGLFGPLDTAQQLHSVNCDKKACGISESYRALFEQIMDATIRRMPSM